MARRDYDQQVKLLLLGDSGECRPGSWALGADSQPHLHLQLSTDDPRSTNVPCIPLPGVGKSCLLLRFSEDEFTSSFITTIGRVPGHRRIEHQISQCWSRILALQWC